MIELSKKKRKIKKKLYHLISHLPWQLVACLYDAILLETNFDIDFVRLIKSFKKKQKTKTNVRRDFFLRGGGEQKTNFQTGEKINTVLKNRNRLSKSKMAAGFRTFKRNAPLEKPKTLLNF